MSRVIRAAVAIAATASCTTAFLAHARVLSLEIDDIVAPAFAVQSLRATLSGPRLRELDLRIGRITVAGQRYGPAVLKCSDLQVSSAQVVCARGMLDAGEKIPVRFSYSTERKDLVLELDPAGDEMWRVSGRLAGVQTTLQIRIEKGRMTQLARWIPAGAPAVSAGHASGTVQVSASAIAARLAIEGAAFADASGLHAGEKLSATIEADATAQGTAWQWAVRAAWHAGQVYWQPLFVAATGQTLRIEGTTSRGISDIRAGELDLPHIGAISFSGRWSHETNALETFAARGARLPLAPLYEQMLKPLLQQTALDALRVQGDVSFALRALAGTVSEFDLELHDVSLDDPSQRRFALFSASGRVPWRRAERSAGELTMKGAEIMKVPLGPVRIPLHLRGSEVAISSVRVPILDGAVHLRDFSAMSGDSGWRWRFSGELEPISMVQLTQALGVPVMYGALAGVIPDVQYRRKLISMDGKLTLGIFDGTVIASGLELADPLGRAPHLRANVAMQGLDLELLTRAVDFGTITGRIDVSLRGLELVDWQPVRFDLQMDSSAGNYPRRISQRAVQNISALGGGGASAALQRSFLRFFEQFGYSRIGLRCRLDNQVCEMDGLEPAGNGYVIVKGGGIPAISVIGYNRRVSWRELVERLKRVTQENVKPIVK